VLGEFPHHAIASDAGGVDETVESTEPGYGFPDRGRTVIERGYITLKERSAGAFQNRLQPGVGRQVKYDRDRSLYRQEASGGESDARRATRNDHYPIVHTYSAPTGSAARLAPHFPQNSNIEGIPLVSQDEQVWLYGPHRYSLDPPDAARSTTQS
jgi:hypothetical protein